MLDKSFCCNETLETLTGLCLSSLKFVKFSRRKKPMGKTQDYDVGSVLCALISIKPICVRRQHFLQPD